MTKQEILELLKLLSALEAAGVISMKLPDYLSDRLTDAVTMLGNRLLEKCDE